MKGKFGTLLRFILELFVSDVCQVAAWFVTRGFTSFPEKVFGGWGISLGEYGLNLDAKRRNHIGKLGHEKGLGYTQLRAINVFLSNVTFLAINGFLVGMTTHNTIKMAIASVLIALVSWAFFLRGKVVPDGITAVVGTLVCTIVVLYFVYDGIAPVVPKFWVISMFLLAGVFWTSARWVHLRWPNLRFIWVFLVCWGIVALGEYVFLALAAKGHVPTIAARGYTDVTQNLAFLAFLLTQKKMARITRLDWAGFSMYFLLSVTMFIVAR